LFRSVSGTSPVTILCARPSAIGDEFEILAGGGFFSLAPGDSQIVAVRYAPETAEQTVCPIETGASLCNDVLCLGEGVEATGAPAVPDERHYALGQNNPNPFNPKTTIHFELAESRPVLLIIYSVDGRKVRVLIDGRIERGAHQVEWNGRDDKGRAMPSGTYFYRLQAGHYLEMRKMQLIR